MHRNITCIGTSMNCCNRRVHRKDGGLCRRSTHEQIQTRSAPILRLLLLLRKELAPSR